MMTEITTAMIKMSLPKLLCAKGAPIYGKMFKKTNAGAAGQALEN